MTDSPNQRPTDATGSVFDMHVHTVRGASDSSLQPKELAREALRLGLTGVVVTEHDRLWDVAEVERFCREHPLRLIRGMEASTDLGHVLVIGLDRYLPEVRYAEKLRRIVSDAGGYLIAAHPFRRQFDRDHWQRQGMTPPKLIAEEAARLPLFQLVDAIEVLNGGNNDQENAFALQVARILGKPGLGGSDAHSHQGIGIYVTIFEREIDSEAALLRELRAGRFHAAHGLR